MEGLGSHLSMWFWNPDIWLPPNVDWNTFKEEKIINSTIVIKPENFANFSDLLYPLPIAFCFIIARVLVEKYILKPLGERLGIQDKPRRQPRPNSSLENFFKKSNKLRSGEALVISRQCGLSEIEVGWKIKDFFCIFFLYPGRDLVRGGECCRLRDGSETRGEPTCPPPPPSSAREPGGSSSTPQSSSTECGSYPASPGCGMLGCAGPSTRTTPWSPTSGGTT